LDKNIRTGQPWRSFSRLGSAGSPDGSSTVAGYILDPLRLRFFIAADDGSRHSSWIGVGHMPAVAPRWRSIDPGSHTRIPKSWDSLSFQGYIHESRDTTHDPAAESSHHVASSTV
jgi:hypothetical protein